MAIRLKCPNCGMIVKPGNRPAGAVAACPKCRSKMRVPAIPEKATDWVEEDQFIESVVDPDDIEPFERPAWRFEWKYGDPKYWISGAAIVGAAILLYLGAQQFSESTKAQDAVKGLGFLVLIIALVVAGACFYFLPTIIGFNRKHPNAAAIFVTNLLFGWTFLGWGIALIWACTHINRSS